MESKQKGEKVDIKYLGLVTALSLTTGFLSGGIQHYLDNSSYAGSLLGIGLVGTYITFFLKEKGLLKAKNIIVVSGSRFSYLSSYSLAIDIKACIKKPS